MREKVYCTFRRYDKVLNSTTAVGLSCRHFYIDANVVVIILFPSNEIWSGPARCERIRILQISCTEYRFHQWFELAAAKIRSKEKRASAHLRLTWIPRHGPDVFLVLSDLATNICCARALPQGCITATMVCRYTPAASMAPQGNPDITALSFVFILKRIPFYKFEYSNNRFRFRDWC